MVVAVAVRLCFHDPLGKVALLALPVKPSSAGLAAEHSDLFALFALFLGIYPLGQILQPQARHAAPIPSIGTAWAKADNLDCSRIILLFFLSLSLLFSFGASAHLGRGGHSDHRLLDKTLVDQQLGSGSARDLDAGNPKRVVQVYGLIIALARLRRSRHRRR